MTEATDLLALAEHLALFEEDQTKQASLRRSISTAYYALFHFLGEEVARLVPAEPTALVMIFRRTLEHQTMKAACDRLVNGQAAALVRSLVQYPLEDDLQRVAEAFRSLQEARHTADYNVLYSWTRTEALSLIDRAREAMTAWPRVAGLPNANVFLVLLSRPLNPRRG